jgi:radical SAM superfamily enzyme YgiQ (UPF0313 family)
MTDKDAGRVDVLLVGYENHENLGLRSIMAYLLQEGYRVALAPFFPGMNDGVLEAVRRHRPRVIGFSLIFQYAIEQFGALMSTLRAAGVNAHLTAGGHFPSLRPEETLSLLPELDSVVRFEGEQTLAELIDRLDRPGEWHRIQGLTFRREGSVVVNPARPLIADLDRLPPVYRDEPREAGRGIPMAAMLASRGCLFDCSFCSIRQFYAGASGPRRRVRTPAGVAAEMRALFEEKGVRFFAFQDDDFAAHSARERAWLGDFLRELRVAGLQGRIRWKISCRVDDLQPSLLEDMIAHGLMAVYLGVESGSVTGLRSLNKRVTVEQNLAAVEMLKQHDVALAVGFMLFDPSSTFDTIRENLTFLRQVGWDGYFPVNFCKMLPYAGTPIEEQLRRTERLRGTLADPDYGFLDPLLDAYAFLVQRIFAKRNFAPDGSVALLQRADFDERLARSFAGGKPATGVGEEVARLAARSNRSVVDTLDALLDDVLDGGIDGVLGRQDALVGLAERAWRTEMEIELALRRLGAVGTDALPQGAIPVSM